MPTGYTFFIENGDISTGSEFLKKCIRAFGCCIGQRDDSLSSPLITKIDSDPYYKEQYENCIKKLECLKHLTSKEIAERILSERKERLDSKKAYLSKQKLLLDKYLKIRREVENWNPPTEEHEGIKVFALEQIDMSIPTENELQSLEKEIERLAKAGSSVDEQEIGSYKIEEIKYLERDIEHYKTKTKDDEKWCAERTQFILDFLGSL